VAGWNVWAARIVLLAFGLAGLIVIFLLQRTGRQRRRLAEEHSRLRILAQVVESAGEAISGRDLDGRFMSWNPAAERLFGWTAAEVIGHGLEHPMHGAQRDVVQAMIRAVTTTRTVQESETSRISDTGQSVLIVVTMAPLFDEHGDIVGVSSSGRDITERRRLEDQLRQSESMFRSAFDGALLGMCLTGLDGRLVRVNEVFATMMGRTTTELTGMHANQLTHPDHRDAHDTRLQQTANGEIDGFRKEDCYLDADGSEVWADSATSVIHNSAGEPEHFVTQLVDITLRRAALRERDARDAMLAAVIANSQSLIFVKDLEGRYLLANEPLQRMFGVTEAELLGQTDQRIERADLSKWRDSDLQARQGPFHLEECVEVDGTLRYFESVRFPLFDAEGHLYSTCGIALDVTERRRAALAAAKARDEAVAATRAKSSFLATMSHEIRTPMNAVIGMTGLLLDTGLDVEQREYVETVRSSGDALLGIINDILDYSKIESGRMELELQPFDLEDLVEGALDLVALQADAKQLDLIADIDPACPPTLVGDVTRIRQVLVNLLSNAVKFTIAGDVIVKATMDETGDGPIRLCLSVADTGIGVPADRMDRLFRSFSQVESSTTRTYGGTGLGLAISARLVEAMDGQIGVDSEPGRGSTFSFSFPTVHQATESPRRPELQAFPGLHALVVDDNPTARRVLQRHLECWGATSDAAGSGASALVLAGQGRHYDFALLDTDVAATDVAGTDGGDLAAALRALPSYGDLPLVLLSSRVGLDDGDGDLQFAARLVRPAKSVLLHRAIVAARRPANRSPAGGPEAPTAGGATSDGAMSAAAPSKPPRSPLRVLLAEDNKVNQRVALLMLDRLGYRADVAGNGIEAIQALRSAPYDLVLMDVQMPEMDGLEATRRIRSEFPPDRQPVIFAMTANAMSDDRAMCLGAGMDDFMSKPFRRDDLADALAGCARPAAIGQQRPPAGPVTPALRVTPRRRGPGVGPAPLRPARPIAPPPAGRRASSG
jgi:PAS domain S-box-containing protein